jgi:hypothetical protein
MEKVLQKLLKGQAGQVKTKVFLNYIKTSKKLLITQRENLVNHNRPCCLIMAQFAQRGTGHAAASARAFKRHLLVVRKNGGCHQTFCFLLSELLTVHTIQFSLFEPSILPKLPMLVAGSS